MAYEAADAILADEGAIESERELRLATSAPYRLRKREDSLLIIGPNAQLSFSCPKQLFTRYDSTGDPNEVLTGLKIEERTEKSSSPAAPTDDESPRRDMGIFGILGLLHAIDGCHLMVIIDQEVVAGAILNGATIYRITQIEILPIPHTRAITPDDAKIEKRYFKSLKAYFEDTYFYHAVNWDLTNSMQRIALQHFESQQETSTGALWSRVDERIPCEIDGTEFEYLLISRRSSVRSGARFLTRGADPHGNAANFVETEQLIAHRGVLSSFVQTRGSVPVLWQQKGSGFKPRIVLQRSVFSEQAFTEHFREQLQRYGRQIVVSLLDREGAERELGEEYELRVRLLANPRIRFVAFDFHSECRADRGGFANLSKVIEEIRRDVGEVGFCMWDPLKRVVMCQQSGTVRTNCVDCLDRTNVLQSAVARVVLEAQLRMLGLLAFDGLDRYSAVDEVLKNVWADNADALSRAYTGSEALKTDYTRTGKRSVKGAFDDGWNAALRYYNQTFRDSDKQDAIDWLTGRLFVARQPDDRLLDCTRFDIHRIGHHFSEEAQAVIDLYGTHEAANGLATSTPRAVGPRQPIIARWLVPRAQLVRTPLSSLKQVSREVHDSRVADLVFDSHAEPEKYAFWSNKSRELFIRQVNSLQRANQLAPTPPPPVSTLRVCVAVWDMTDVGAPFSLNWLPVSSDPQSAIGLYVVATQHVDFATPSGFYFGATAYWQYAVIKHINELSRVAMETVAAVRTPGGAVLLVLTSPGLRGLIANIKISAVTVASETTAKSLIAARAVSAVRSLKARLIGSPNSSANAEGDSGSANEQLPKTEKLATAAGVAVSFNFQETPLCFVHSVNPTGVSMATPLVLGDLHRELEHDFDHVFMMGRLPQGCLDPQKYWALDSRRDSDSGVYWRPRQGCTLSEVTIAQRSTAAHAVDTTLCQPACVTMCIELCMPPDVAIESGCIIRLSELAGMNLTTAQSRRIDPYVLFVAPFIEPGTKTPVVYKTHDPVWDEDVVLSVSIVDTNFLERSHIKACVFDSSVVKGDTLIGSCLIPLKGTFGAQPQAFRCIISLHDQPRGVLAGKIQCIPR